MANQFSEVVIKDENVRQAVIAPETVNSGPKEASIARRKFTSHNQKLTKALMIAS